MNDIPSGDAPGEPQPSGARTALALIDPRALRRSLLLRFLADVSDSLILAGEDVAEVCRQQEGANDVATVIVNAGGESLARDGHARAQVAAAASAFPDAPIVVLSDLESRQETFETLNLGVRGFIPTSTPEHLVWPAIQLVAAGGLYAPVGLLLSLEYGWSGDGGAQAAPDCRSPKAANTDVEDSSECGMHTAWSSRDGSDSGPAWVEDRLAVLTPREIEVLGRVRQGLQNKQIAYELGMSESTVKVHVRHILKKLAVTNRTQAAFHVTSLAPQLPDHIGKSHPVRTLEVWGSGAPAANGPLATVQSIAVHGAERTSVRRLTRPFDYALSGTRASARSATL